MAGKRIAVPDAWDDDDWEAKADRAAAAGSAEAANPDIDAGLQPSMTKAQRLAHHAESNKKLWQSAEAPSEPFHFLAAHPETPLANEFKPAVKVLSRKPAPQMITKRDPVTGALSRLQVDDGDSDDEKDKVKLTPEEIRAKQQRDREEKQRRYDEVRAKIFGTTPAATTSGSGNGSNPSSGTSTPGNATPPRSVGEGRGSRGRGRGRGGGGHRYNDSRGDSGGSQRPGSQPGHSGRDLYDPNNLPRPTIPQERRSGGALLSGRSTPRDDDQVIRSPRGPDGKTRGFAKRGAKGD